MKTLIIILGCLLIPFQARAISALIPNDCINKTYFERMPLRQHIDCMGRLLQAASSDLKDPSNRQNVADNLLEVRRHLQFTIGMTPGRLEAVNPDQRRMPFLEYQMLSAEAMLLVGKLELKVLNTRYWDAPASDISVYELSNRLEKVIGTAYQKFGN